MNQEKPKIKKIARKNPSIGAKIIPAATLMSPLLTMAEIPTETKAAPMSPPIKEWVTEIGMPYFVEKIVQIIAPIKAKIKRDWEVISG